MAAPSENYNDLSTTASDNNHQTQLTRQRTENNTTNRNNTHKPRENTIDALNGICSFFITLCALLRNQCERATKQHVVGCGGCAALETGEKNKREIQTTRHSF
jgi:hypothetical protein